VTSTSSPTKRVPHNLSGYVDGGFTYHPPYGLERAFLTARWPSLLRPPIAQTLGKWHRNINRLSIDYAFRPRLRSRLTLGGLAFPRKPQVFGGPDSHRPYRYSYRHNHSYAVQRSLRYTFDPHTTLPYHPSNPEGSARSAASVTDLSPGNYRRKAAQPVSYYALFKWWLLLSQHPGCHSNFTSLST
jgi:hypothetical protein